MPSEQASLFAMDVCTRVAARLQQSSDRDAGSRTHLQVRLARIVLLAKAGARRSVLEALAGDGTL